MEKYKIALLPGDGIGPEVIGEGVKVLDAVAKKFGYRFEYKEGVVGGAAYDRYRNPLPDETLEICDYVDAIYFGAVGGPKWEKLPSEFIPERGLLTLRKKYDLFANLRPAVIFPPLLKASSLKLSEELDIMIVRELTSGIYFGNKRVDSLQIGRKEIMPGENVIDDERIAADVMLYTEPEIKRIAKTACDISKKRKKKLTSVDKANVLACSRLWRKVVSEFVMKNYPEIELKHLYVDNAAMQLGTYPQQFDVIVTGNMFGDILSDLAAAITGSIGMLPSASLNESGFGMYEPVHGSAPDIAGRGIANPLAQILSGAMMLRYSFGLQDGADAIENAVKKVLEDGFRTGDIAMGSPEEKIIGTKEMGDRVAEYIGG